MRTEVASRLTMSRATVSARHDASSNELHSWVWVFPARDGTFRVSTVEIPKNLVDDECFAEEDLSRDHIATVRELSAVDEVVRNLGVDPNSLDAPWKNDFPL
ncbi:hypothetical protein [Streptomyces sp. NBC_00091]|uniref:hypothetical protein n=1 Tax=Streptomyces sp. NBC_00091 TaxID=2975648 RepID=UPI00224EE278|nr:hypothetical protein [Streptomyces sp. NBC_00091]MCX5376757.1 hypothetical protein [Streptomyces sp. NBC_00091]